MKYLETLVKFYIKQKGLWVSSQKEIDSLQTLHEYFWIAQDFVFLVELAYECEIGKDTLLKWAEEVRQEALDEQKAKQVCETVLYEKI